VSSLRTFVYEQAVEVPVQVRSEVQLADVGVAGNLTYVSGEPLEEALLVWGDSAQSLGTLTPGTSKQLDLRANRGNFPNGGALARSEGLFNRRNVLTALFNAQPFGVVGPNGFQSGFPDRDGVYLLGWAVRPTADVQLNGSNAAQEGLTLYVIKLNAAPQ
jgi:hypothetical protein